MKKSRLVWVGAASAAVAIVIPAALASTAPSITTNLIKNGGGDLGRAAADSSSTVPSIPRWTKTGDFTTVVYGAPGGFPDATLGKAIKGGKNFFAGGPANPDSGAKQLMSLGSRAVSIDKGNVVATLSGHLGGYSSQRDSLTVVATFLDAAGQKLGSMRIGPVTPVQRKSLTTMIRRSASKAVPATTRKVEIQIRATRTDGSYNDGYADNLSLTLRTP